MCKMDVNGIPARLIVHGHDDAVRAKNMRLVHGLLLKIESANIIHFNRLEMSHITRKESHS